MILIACGLQREASILTAPGILPIPGGGESARLEAALEAQVPGASMILSCGIAGALAPALKAGDVVLDLAHGPAEMAQHLQAALPHAHLGTIIGQDHIAATVAEKAVLHATTGALAVSPFSNVIVTLLPFSVTPVHLRPSLIASGFSRRIASSSMACRSPRWNMV